MVNQQRQRFHGLFDTVAELNRMREFWRAGVESPVESGTHATAWIPRMDIFNRGDDLIIRCELAGVAPHEVDVSLEHGALTIFGERTGAPEEPDTTFYVRERHFGSFRRTINLPEGIQRSSIDASLDEGLLEITVAGGCAAARAPEHIDIRVGGDRGR
ncbi:MAG TPA: Hsp20/alpha crystallin family protein [Solirubrobacteraceae bacterium]|nr:Hsp20/alpha crystallin family protein [Solirubrobacteraceae bacterium]